MIIRKIPEEYRGHQNQHHYKWEFCPTRILGWTLVGDQNRIAPLIQTLLFLILSPVNNDYFSFFSFFLLLVWFLCLFSVLFSLFSFFFINVYQFRIKTSAGVQGPGGIVFQNEPLCLFCQCVWLRNINILGCLNS